MGRKPIGTKAMTPAERQRRRRAKLARRERQAEAVDDLTLADGYWTKAASHTFGARALVDRARLDAVEEKVEDVEQMVFNGKYSAAIHLLVGYALELLLKSAFILCSGDARRLKSYALRHDLVGLFDEAERLGFEPEYPRLRWIAVNLADPHKSHQFRYGGAEQVAMPQIEESLSALFSLCTQVRRMLDESQR